jgi:hypothetical protein
MEGIVKFAFEWGNKRTQNHLPFNQNVGQLFIQNSLIASIQMDKVITIVLHTTSDLGKTFVGFKSKTFLLLVVITFD